MKYTVYIFISLLILGACIDNLHEELETLATDVEASFEIENNGCKAPCEVRFINKSTNATSYEWDFGDGNTSDEFNPTHRYELGKDYTVNLKAINDGENDTESRPISINFYTFKKTFGGIFRNWGSSLKQNKNGEYILLGDTYNESTGSSDMYLIKTDNTGNLLWEKRMGGIDDARGYSVQQTQDEGYVLLGYTQSEGAIFSDMYLVKTNNFGTEKWSKTFGGEGRDIGNSVQQTQDRGYILLGYTQSESANTSDIFLIKGAGKK